MSEEDHSRSMSDHKLNNERDFASAPIRSPRILKVKVESFQE